MTTPAREGGRWRIVVLADDARTALGLAVPGAIDALASGGCGEPIVRHRSSWTHRIRRGAIDCHAKTYVYPTWRDRCRGLGRTTWLAPSRAAREAAAAGWLRARGFAAPRTLLVAERRRLGLLHAALLVTETLPGTTLERALGAFDTATRTRVLGALAAWVRALHAAGFRDRNLDLRNIVLLPGPEPAFAKLDSPRAVLDSADARLAAADWARLTASLAAAGFAWPAGAGR